MSENIDVAIKAIEKAHGKGSIMSLSSDKIIPVETISSSSLALDHIMGGGFPRGRIVEIYGPEASGKSTLAQSVVAQAQKISPYAGYIDMEHTIDPAYAEKIGVNLDTLLISQPQSGEQAIGIAETLINSGEVSVVVVDSVSALVPQAELDGDVEDAHVGLQARLMSKALQRLSGAVASNRTCLIFINQIREKIGVMFGSPETTSGGRALKFYTTVRIDIRRKAAIKVGDKIVGARTKCKTVKNKIAPPFREAEFDIIYGEGISKEGDALDMGVYAGVVEKTGAYLRWNGETLGQGREKAREFLLENPEMLGKIQDAIKHVIVS